MNVAQGGLQMMSQGGPLPQSLIDYHRSHPELDISANALQGLFDSNNPSQCYVELQEKFFREIFYVTNLNDALKSGKYDDFYNAVKLGHEQHAAKETDDEKFQNKIYSFMDEAGLSLKLRNKLMKIM